MNVVWVNPLKKRKIEWFWRKVAVQVVMQMDYVVSEIPFILL